MQLIKKYSANSALHTNFRFVFQENWVIFVTDAAIQENRQQKLFKAPEKCLAGIPAII